MTAKQYFASLKVLNLDVKLFQKDGPRYAFHFRLIPQQSGRLQVLAAGKHADSLSALIILLFYFTECLGLNTAVIKVKVIGLFGAFC